jgi:hypothetical protein
MSNQETSPAGAQSRLFVRADGFLIETMPGATGDTVAFTAQGGGFVQHLPRAAFEETFKPAPASSFARRHVSGEWLPEDLRLPAYTDGRRWNGWAMPYFEFEVAKQLLDHMDDLRYDADKDAFVNTSDDDETFEATTVEVDAISIKVYPIGAGCWCWCEED